MGSNDGKNEESGLNLEKEREEDKLHGFLKALDESLYGSVKSNLLSRESLPSLDDAYGALLQDEDSKHTSRVLNGTAEMMAYEASTSTNSGAARSYPSREERANLHYFSCGKRDILLRVVFGQLDILSGGRINLKAE
ncbi:hypothetical protein Bca52824_002130 [Brassica carinata]|uniref:Uncharacterized protein n=1 Tax=Brassica carinata TaxID=52824 RepID=A0A8X7WKK9_BRACI|nr:hypothetical protein Bca52824_002130 [Brassica carinata]